MNTAATVDDEAGRDEWEVGTFLMEFKTNLLFFDLESKNRFPRRPFPKDRHPRGCAPRLLTTSGARGSRLPRVAVRSAAPISQLHEE